MGGTLPWTGGPGLFEKKTTSLESACVPLAFFIVDAMPPTPSSCHRDSTMMDDRWCFVGKQMLSFLSGFYQDILLRQQEEKWRQHRSQESWDFIQGKREEGREKGFAVEEGSSSGQEPAAGKVGAGQDVCICLVFTSCVTVGETVLRMPGPSLVAQVDGDSVLQAWG